MLIDINETPNPNALKFVLEFVINEGDALTIDRNESQRYAITASLFEIDGIELVFFGRDFITVSKNQETSWDILKPQILSNIMNCIVEGKFKITKDPSAAFNEQNFYQMDDESKIIQIIETRIKPAVARDGGDIVFKYFKDGVVYVEMRGACNGCPSSSITLKKGVESMLKHYVSSVHSVEGV